MSNTAREQLLQKMQKPAVNQGNTQKTVIHSHSDAYLNKTPKEPEPVLAPEAKQYNKPPVTNIANTTNTEPTQRVRVDISIAGVTYKIVCPSDSVDKLNHTAEQLSRAVREIRQNPAAKSKSQDELLVLHCLELYEQIDELKKARDTLYATQSRADNLVDQLIKQAQAIV